MPEYLKDPFTGSFSLVYNVFSIGDEAIISMFIAVCKRFAYDGFMKSIFLVSPLNLVRFTAEFLKTVLKTSSVMSSQSSRFICNSCSLGLNLGSE
jgi:hypothetical protein